MRVRAIRPCSHPLYDGDRNHMIREGWEGEWNCSGDLPPCFAEVTEPEPKPPAAEPVLSAVHPSLMALDRDGQILEALNRMDHSDNEHWTQLGLPRVEVVSEILAVLGFDSEVTRPEINVALPGFARN